MPLTQKQKTEKYHQDRANLIYYLGGKCVHCGTKEQLEFDHLEPRGYDPSKLNRWTRLKKYTEESEQGTIQLLCSDCNKRKGQPIDPNNPEEEIPE